MNGNKWARITTLIGNRGEATVKNRFKSLLNKVEQRLDKPTNRADKVKFILQQKQETRNETRETKDAQY